MIENKHEIRKVLLKERALLSKETVIGKSLLIHEKLFGTKIFREAEGIFSYLSFKNEVQTKEIIDKALELSKSVGIPLVKGLDIVPISFSGWETLKKGAFGIFEPREPFSDFLFPEETLVLVPGLAFSRKGERIGFGKGFYDRFLSERKGFKTVGLCYDFQLSKSLPVEEHDVLLDMIITENECIEVKKDEL